MNTRECLGGLVERSITSEDLITELDRLTTQRGYPMVLRCDNGPELACGAMADRGPANTSAYTSSRPISPGGTAMSSGLTAGDHFTPREVIALMVDILFHTAGDALTKPGTVRTIYDPAAGTGGMLSTAYDHLVETRRPARCSKGRTSTHGPTRCASPT